jgi:hypothetical protein
MRFDPTNLALLLVIVLGITICVGGVYINRRKRLTLQTRFGNRESLTIDTIHEQYFRELPRRDVEVVLTELASTLEVPLGLLRPTDRFDSELAYPRGFGYDGRMESLAATFRGHLKRQGVNNVAKYPETVGDFVRATVPTNGRA